MEECVFCKIVRGELPTKKIFETDNFIAIPDAFPQVEGHSLIIPKKHFESCLDLPSNLGEELVYCVKEVALRLMKEFGCDGFNLLNNNFESAGQVVKHVHFHILPRKKGDGELKFCKGGGGGRDNRKI